jgi:hypothetical protein
MFDPRLGRPVAEQTAALPASGPYAGLARPEESGGRRHSRRRFDAVICESIERVARRTNYGTKIEHDLEASGVALFAADEPISLTGKRTTTIARRSACESTLVPFPAREGVGSHQRHVRESKIFVSLTRLLDHVSHRPRTDEACRDLCPLAFQVCAADPQLHCSTPGRRVSQSAASRAARRAARLATP